MLQVLADSGGGSMIATMYVGHIIREEDRTLLYETNTFWYHVIAPCNAKVQVGDRISFELDGANFGWLREVK